MKSNGYLPKIKRLCNFFLKKVKKKYIYDLTSEKNIRNIPVLIFYDGDNEVDRLVGAVSLSKINEIIDKWKQ